MIRSFRHKGLKRLYEDDDSSGVLAEHLTKLRNILVRLDAAGSSEDMSLPAFNLHLLKGELRGFLAVTVRANWRVLFRFEEGNAYDVDYLDYH
jgi:proteic killer suppression protein